jgi:hypothetical protein
VVFATHSDSLMARHDYPVLLLARGRLGRQPGRRRAADAEPPDGSADGLARAPASPAAVEG